MNKDTATEFNQKSREQKSKDSAVQPRNTHDPYNVDNKMINEE